MGYMNFSLDKICTQSITIMMKYQEQISSQSDHKIMSQNHDVSWIVSKKLYTEYISCLFTFIILTHYVLIYYWTYLLDLCIFNSYLNVDRKLRMVWMGKVIKVVINIAICVISFKTSARGNLIPDRTNIKD